jgi:hypothetical protein
MRVAYFPNQCALNSVPVVQAMLASLRKAGHTTIENGDDCDAAIIWSALWHGRMAPNQSIYEQYRAQNRPVIIVDVGSLYRGETWKIAVNHINRLGYYGHTENLDMDRPRKLGISLALNFTHNPRIVVAAQHAHSLQVADLPSVESWITEQVQQIQQVTDRPITIRPHPRSKLDTAKLLPLSENITIEQPVKLTNTYDSYNLMFDCHAVVNYNSGPGIQAALAGTRPIVDCSSLAHPVGISIKDIDQPYTVDRDQWLIEICHTEYTVKEIEQGQWLTRLRPHLNT